MKLRVYTDTSVLGGCLDEEFSDVSIRLMEAFEQGAMQLVLSELTLRELETAPEAVKEVIDQVPKNHNESVSLSVEAEQLAHAHIADGAVSLRMYADAMHIALATVAHVSVLVSWNFKHIVNLQRIHAYNAVNLKNGYPQLEIRTPREALSDE